MRLRVSAGVFGAVLLGAVVLLVISERQGSRALTERLDAVEEQLEQTASWNDPESDSPPTLPPSQWLVQAKQTYNHGDTLLLTIDYVGPNGDLYTWQRDLTSHLLTRGTVDGFFDCWDSALVGVALPACASGSDSSRDVIERLAESLR